MGKGTEMHKKKHGKATAPAEPGLCSAWMPPALVVVVIGFVYAVVVMFVFAPQLSRAMGNAPAGKEAAEVDNYTPSMVEIVSLIVSFHVLFVMVWICFIRSVMTPPGAIPQRPGNAQDAAFWKKGKFGISDESEKRLQAILHNTSLSSEELAAQEAFLKSLPVVERKKRSKGAGVRFCWTCQLYKPDRTHHCRVCNKCVLRMDHHCPWIANCVGFANYKFFLLFLLYGWTTAAFALGIMTRRMLKAFRPILDTSLFLKHDLPVLVAYGFCLFLFVALCMFFFFHVDIATGSLSTIELKEKKDSKDKVVQHRWAVAHTKFDRGSKFANAKHVLGPVWMWLLPLAPPYTATLTDGTYSEDMSHLAQGAV